MYTPEPLLKEHYFCAAQAQMNSVAGNCDEILDETSGATLKLNSNRRSAGGAAITAELSLPALEDCQRRGTQARNINRK